MDPAGSPSLTLALALAAGVLGLVVARHLRLPGIVLLLAAGILLGPDMSGLIQPRTLGAALPILVEFAVAVILFEGGLNLDLRRLRREGQAIQRLVTVGALITAAGGALAARLCMGWEWMPALLFGTLVIVTGPTVVTPLLRRIKIRRDVETVLEAEGVLIDPIGAIIALVALQVVIGAHPGVHGLAAGTAGVVDGPGLHAASSATGGMALGGAALDVVERLGLGLVFGAAGGALMGLLLRVRRVIPEGLENIVTLGLLLGLVMTSETLMPATGVMTATMAGLVVGNMRTPVLRDLREFKEQLTFLLIGLLFVLLAADVRLAGVLALGLPGVATVLVLMLAVRPIQVLVCTAGLAVPWRQRLFMAWLAPRGIVAAAVASHFALVLGEAGQPGGDELLALVFLVIAMTVVVQGLTGGLVARLLGLSRGQPAGLCIYGAHKLGRTLAQLLAPSFPEVVLIESRHDFSQQAQEEKLRLVYGNGLEERTLLRARLDTMAVAIGLSDNEEGNLLFAQRARQEFKVRDVYVALQAYAGNVTPRIVEDAGARLLFGREIEIERWFVRLERELAVLEVWEWGGDAGGGKDGERAGEGDNAGGGQLTSGEGSRLPPGPVRPPATEPATAWDASLLPLCWQRGDRVQPCHDGVRWKARDRVTVALFVDQEEAARRWQRSAGWRTVEPTAANEPVTGAGATGVAPHQDEGGT